MMIFVRKTIIAIALLCSASFGMNLNALKIKVEDLEHNIKAFESKVTSTIKNIEKAETILLGIIGDLAKIDTKDKKAEIEKDVAELYQFGGYIGVPDTVTAKEAADADI